MAFGFLNRKTRRAAGISKQDADILNKKNNKDTKEKGDKTKDEIERKFLMKSFPDDRSFLLEASLIHQAYLSVEPEVRIRSRIYEDGTSECNETIKGNGQLVRKEIDDIKLTEKQFDDILKLINLKPIEKEYKKYVLDDGMTLEVSKVDNKFYYAEVEFESEEQANSWTPPETISEFIIKEVTYDDEYKMKNYWKRTRLNK